MVTGQKDLCLCAFFFPEGCGTDQCTPHAYPSMFPCYQRGVGTEKELNTGTVGTLLPGTKSGTGTVRAAFSGTATGTRTVPLCSTVWKHREVLAPERVVRTKNRNCSNRPVHKQYRAHQNYHRINYSDVQICICDLFNRLDKCFCNFDGISFPFKSLQSVSVI